MKKVLLLGGARPQIPSILMAKKLGCYAITCDYLPNNPGHAYADEYYNVSTTDKEAVLKLARQLKIDGIVAYASDPAASTAAFVAEAMSLPTSPFQSVEILSRKDLFRQFLRDNGFHTPNSGGFVSYEEAVQKIDQFRFPVMVKPVDSSGSKGINKITSPAELKEAVDQALEYSRSKKFIIEEFIEKKGYQISGDGFSVDGKLVFRSFGNEFYSDKGIKNYVPLGEFWPCLLSKELQQKIHDEIQRLISLLGMKTTAYNIEVILDQEDNVYILELGPRSGGSYIPQLIELATGVNMVEYVVKAAIGESCDELTQTDSTGFYSNYMLHSTKTGRFKQFVFDDCLKDNVIEVFSDFQKGMPVQAFENAGHSLGTALFRFQSMEEMLQRIEKIDQYVQVDVE